ncbi:DUF1631 family protein [Rhodoferax sp.]|uniref:DUF1631 family protein n=1 Tax=Rhodoferax sp. TaxID=50421 RepID=UPI0019E0201C|nr:DUF1631 family protein [Rhodoferax sp.]MBE0473001.1 DUF1631 family protein [Rhodoferax sp.]
MTAAEHYLNLFRAALGQSARDGEGLLREVFHAALRSLDAEIAHSPGLPERDQLRLSRQFLDKKAAALCAQFPALLRQALQSKQVTSSQFGELAMGELSHDLLEQMDETQVQERVEMARVLRLVHNSAQDSLCELDSYMSTLLGRDQIRPEGNPLRPKIYLKVLHELLVDAAVPTSTRIIWFGYMATPLGKALKGSYASLAKNIQSYGVPPLLSVKKVEPQRPSVQPEQANLLTLDRVHGLFAGQSTVQQNKAPDEAEAQFSGEFESNAWDAQEDTDEPTTDFAATIPAAFMALQNMNQVEDVVARLPQGQRAPPGTASQSESIRQKYRRRCQNSAQVLSFEVMCQMLDNLLQDTRLLGPIRRVIEDLEPALFRLVKVDVRFFNNKLHPARRLLQEVTQRGLAFDSVDAPGYALFIRSLHRYVNPLSRMPVHSAEPFELALRNLNAMWSEQSAVTSQTVEQAMQALGRAEERNLRAEKMVAALEQIPDMQRVNASVAQFLYGPWAQVMAYAELNNVEGVEDPGGYKELVNLLLWSAQPELTRQHVASLTREMARLLSKLREGLALINYPANQTSLFFDVLTQLHQQALRPSIGESRQQNIAPKENPLGDYKHWLAPEEAQASGFMEMFDEAPPPAPADGADLAGKPMLESVLPQASQVEPVSSAAELAQLTVGAWLEMRVQGTWQRSQLSWISPQSSLYLFTNVNGNTQSMTRRVLEKMLAVNALRVVSEQSVVDDALNAVVHAAMLNSLDIKL